MNALETQVIKIEIGNHKTTNTYIFLGAEEMPNNGAELYCILELPVLNPAAIPDCIRITQAIAASFRRSFISKLHEHSFENSLAHINEELQKLTNLGQTHWIGKLNAVLAAKIKNTLSIATLGKVNALLLRNNSASELTSDNSNDTSIRAFENFTSGKLKIDDILIFSTAELFNYVSLERLKSLLKEYSTPQAAQEIVRILKENAGPEVGFGTIIAQQALASVIQPSAPIVETANTPQPEHVNTPTKVKHAVASALFHVKKLKPAALWRNKLSKTEHWNVKNFFSANKPAVSQLGNGLGAAKDAVNLNRLSTFSPAKKFFLVSTLLLLCALGINILLTRNSEDKPSGPSLFIQNITQIQEQLATADTIIIGGDTIAGKTLLEQIKTSVSTLPQATTPEEQTLLSKTQDKLAELEAKTEGKQQVSVEDLGVLTDSQSLIKTANGFASINSNLAYFWESNTKLVTEKPLEINEDIIAHASLSPSDVFLYTGTSMYLWNPDSGQLTGPFSLTLPALNEFGGLETFAPVNKVYSVNKITEEINTLTFANGDLISPTVWTSSAELSQALDIAIDGSVYILTKQNILIFRQGRLSQTLALSAGSPLSASALIFTSDKHKKLYILDRGNNRILVLSKQGELEKNFFSPEFTNLKDFYVDEANQTIYLLNGGRLQRFIW